MTKYQVVIVPLSSNLPSCSYCVYCKLLNEKCYLLLAWHLHSIWHLINSVRSCGSQWKFTLSRNQLLVTCLHRTDTQLIINYNTYIMLSLNGQLTLSTKLSILVKSTGNFYCYWQIYLSNLPLTVFMPVLVLHKVTKTKYLQISFQVNKMIVKVQL